MGRLEIRSPYYTTGQDLQTQSPEKLNPAFLPEVCKESEETVILAVNHLPEKQRQRIHHKANNILTGSGDTEAKAHILNSLFATTNSNDFMVEIEQRDVTQRDVSAALKDEDMRSLTTTMLQNPSDYRMPLGIILSTIVLDKIHPETLESVRIQKSVYDITLTPAYPGWELCDDAEHFLTNAIEDDAVMRIGSQTNPDFLVKFAGKVTALCLQNVPTTEGKLFISGNWYSPTDKKTRTTLQTAFDDGKGTIDLPKGEWSFMRPLQDHEQSAQTRLEEVSTAAQEIPDLYFDPTIVLPCGKEYTRRGYRRAYKEAF